MIPDPDPPTPSTAEPPSPGARADESAGGFSATAEPPRCRLNRVDVLGVAIDDVTFDEAVARIAALVADGRASGRSSVVVTPNPEMVVQARDDAALAAALAAAALATPDGIGIRFAARLLGTPVRAVVPGSALSRRVAAAAAREGWRLFLLGADEGVAAAAAARLVDDHPGLVVAGTFAGSPRPGDREAVRAALRAAGPIDVLMVAYGTPAQEIWLDGHLAGLGIPVGMGVGGTFNFLAGVSRWPPRWVQRLGLIWLWRLATEPWRWRRQLRLVRFVGLVLREAFGRRVGGGSSGSVGGAGSGGRVG